MNVRYIALLASLASATLTFAGCTTEAWYEGMKRSAENECRRQPSDEGDRCLSRLNKKSYDDYEKERAAPKK